MNTSRFRRNLLATGLLALGLGALCPTGTSTPASTSGYGPASDPVYQVTCTDPDGPGERPAGPERIQGELILDLQDDASAADREALLSRLGLQAEWNSPNSAAHGLLKVHVSEEQMPQTLAALEKEPLAESVSPNYLYSVPEEQAGISATAPASGGDFPNDPMGNQQWHMRQIHAPESWPISTGQGVTVAVIDTGVGYRQFGELRPLEDLENTRIVEGYDFVHDRREAVDDHAHGSHCAGTIAQSTNNGKGVMGVAFGAAIMPIKVLSARGSGSLGDIADGIYFSADHGARVINMSLGGPYADSTLGNAVRKAHQQGVIVVCAAGNSSAGRPGYPANYPEAVAVSAVDSQEELTFYSNRGPAVDIAAPGGDTRADRNGDGYPDGVLQNVPVPGNPTQHDYMYFMGTSMACPHVAGVSALVESLGVTRPEAVEKLLYATARSKGAEGKEQGYGAGVVDARRAVWKAGIEYGAWRLGLGLALLMLPVLAMLRRGYLLGVLLAAPAAVFAASGVFFLGLLSSSPIPASWMLTTALPSWGLHLFGSANHGNPLFFSALLPVLLSLLTVDSRPLRAVTAGLSAGWAAHLLFAAATGSVAVMFVPSLLSPLWLLANALFLVFLSTVLGEEQPT